MTIKFYSPSASFLRAVHNGGSWLLFLGGKFGAFLSLPPFRQKRWWHAIKFQSRREGGKGRSSGIPLFFLRHLLLAFPPRPVHNFFYSLSSSSSSSVPLALTLGRNPHRTRRGRVRGQRLEQNRGGVALDLGRTDAAAARTYKMEGVGCNMALLPGFFCPLFPRSFARRFRITNSFVSSPFFFAASTETWAAVCGLCRFRTDGGNL